MVLAITTSEMVQWDCSQSPKPSPDRGNIEYLHFDSKISILEGTRPFQKNLGEDIGFSNK